MPGLFGVLGTVGMRDDHLTSLGQRMALAMKTRPWLGVEIRTAPGFCGGQVHLDLPPPSGHPNENESATPFLWMDGELFESGAEDSIGPPRAKVRGWLEDDGAGLRAVDGCFALANWEPDTGTLTLATDRLGYRPLYVAQQKGWFAFASEVKALLAVLDHLPEVDQIALRQLLGFEAVLGERTLWEGIRLLPAATVCTVSPRGRQDRTYWSFAEIRRDPVPAVEVRHAFARLWHREIARRRRPGVMPLLLSGGLDSRLVLAELRRQGQDVLTLTFGEAGTPDMEIAARCARLARAPHRRLVLDDRSWWHGREEALWQVDGMVSAIHLHVVRARDELRSGTRYTVKNLVANALFGGRGIRKDTLPLWPGGLDQELAHRYTPNPFVEVGEAIELARPDTAASMVGPSPIAFSIAQFFRRRTLTGCLALQAHCEVAIPGVDLATLELMLGRLTDQDLMKSQFYADFLAQEYPAYFRDIPWQQTGRGLRETPLTRVVRSAHRRILRRLGRATRSRSFADYDRLVGASELMGRYREGALLVDESLGGRAAGYLETIPSAKGWSHAALAVISVEVYLRQAAGLTAAPGPRG